MKEVSEGSLFLIASTHYISKVILCTRNNRAGHISHIVLDSLDGEVKAYFSGDYIHCEDKTGIVFPIAVLSNI